MPACQPPSLPVVHHVLDPVELRRDGERGRVEVELGVGERDARAGQGVLEGFLEWVGGEFARTGEIG